MIFISCLQDTGVIIITETGFTGCTYIITRMDVGNSLLCKLVHQVVKETY